jgi:hypothetical protein
VEDVLRHVENLGGYHRRFFTAPRRVAGHRVLVSTLSLVWTQIAQSDRGALGAIIRLLVAVGTRQPALAHRRVLGLVVMTGFVGGQGTSDHSARWSGCAGLNRGGGAGGRCRYCSGKVPASSR